MGICLHSLIKGLIDYYLEACIMWLEATSLPAACGDDVVSQLRMLSQPPQFIYL
jgi:hypothetical protein